jgi:guanidinoacetate N-methyltransferase
LTRKIKRKKDFEITVTLKNNEFIRPPREAQRNWLLNEALNEFSRNLEALDEIAEKFVPGIENMPLEDRTQAELDDDQIMEDWQVPLMQALADVVTESHGDVLEIGFGRGVSAEMIQARGVRSHTIIECNNNIIRRFEEWRANHADQDIRIVAGKWQDVLPSLGKFDGIFFHTYPLNEAEFIEQIGDSATFAQHFFPHAADHLLDGGVFTYLSNEIDSLSRTHQRALFRYFRSITLGVLDNLRLPEDVHDAWWSDSMVVVKAVK